jgi:hypothetical protein
MFSLNSGKFVQIGDCFNKAGSRNKKERLLNVIEVKVRVIAVLFCCTFGIFFSVSRRRH